MLPAQARAVPPANRVMRQSHGIRNLPEASAGLLGECRRRWTVWSPQGFSMHTCEHACCETLAKTHRMKSKSFTLRAAGHRPHPARDLHLRAHTAVLSVSWRPPRTGNAALHLLLLSLQANLPGPWVPGPQSGALREARHPVPTHGHARASCHGEAENHACLARLGIHAGSLPAQARHMVSHGNTHAM